LPALSLDFVAGLVDEQYWLGLDAFRPGPFDAKGMGEGGMLP